MGQLSWHEMEEVWIEIWWPPDPTRASVRDLGTGEEGATGSFQSSIWVDISLTMCFNEGGSYRSASTPTFSYVAARLGHWNSMKRWKADDN